MSKFRTLSLLGVFLIAGSLLTACAGSAESIFSSDKGEAPAVAQSRAANKTDQIFSDPVTFFITLPNGAKVLCGGINDVSAGYGAGTNLTCDWTNAQGLNKPAQ